MNLTGSKALQSAVYRFKKRFIAKAVILMYHSIIKVDQDPWASCVTPQNFAEHLEVIKKYGNPISLRQLARAHQKKNIPHQAIVITFDDGYADNLYNAKPILESYDIPATAFLTTGYIDSNREFWWDELEQLLLQPGKLPKNLVLSIDDGHQWAVGPAFDYTDDDYQKDRGLMAWEGAPGSRLDLYHSIWQQLQPWSIDKQKLALDELVDRTNLQARVRETHRPLSLEEVYQLDQGNLIEVGAHTLTHAQLPAHPIAYQQYEVLQNKTQLQEILGHEVSMFSYPFGACSPETVSIIRESGFICACSTKEDTVSRDSDCLKFPRFAVQNWDGEQFARHLHQWFQH